MLQLPPLLKGEALIMRARCADRTPSLRESSGTIAKGFAQFPARESNRSNLRLSFQLIVR